VEDSLVVSESSIASGVHDSDEYLRLLQEIGMEAMRRIFEESDFLKLLIGIQKLSTPFFKYSLSLSKRKTSILPLLFSALENYKSCEDAYKTLIITIRVQDHMLLSCGDSDAELSCDELHRLLLLLPFFMQQFIGVS